MAANQIGSAWRGRVILAVGGAVLLAAAVTLWLAVSDPADEIHRLQKAGDVDALARLAQSPDTPAASRAVLALGAVGGPDVKAPLLRAAAATRPALREHAAVALVRAGKREHAELLATMMRSDKSAEVRAAAANALGQVYACEQMPDLINAIEDDAPIVRDRAYLAVTRILEIEFDFRAADPVEKREAFTIYARKMWEGFGKSLTQYHYEIRKR